MDLSLEMQFGESAASPLPGAAIKKEEFEMMQTAFA
jgi:hypothetical protein